jgi:hypothetical protein
VQIQRIRPLRVIIPIPPGPKLRGRRGKNEDRWNHQNR